MDRRTAVRCSRVLPSSCCRRTKVAACLAGGMLGLALAGCGGGNAAVNTAVQAPVQASGQYVIIDAAGGASTSAQDINDAGDIAGYFQDANRVQHGFLRASDGTLTLYDAPGAGTATNQGTDAQRINSSDTIAGSFVDQFYVSHGYVRSANGTFTVFDVPGSAGTFVTGINDAGTVTGYYLDVQSQDSHGFVRAADGTITVFDGPTTIFGPGHASPASINSSGTIVGVDYEQGFVRTPDGSTSLFDASGQGDATTAPADINDASVVVGGVSTPVLCDPADVSCIANPGNTGFARSFFGAGAFTMFTPPFPNVVNSTARGVNAGGTIVGTYGDTNQVSHGYLRLPDGSFFAMDAPNAAQTPRYGTVPLHINRSGAVVGIYVDANGVRHGFLLH